MSVVLTLPTREDLVVDLEAATTVGDLAREVEAQFGVSAFELSFNDEVLRDGKVALSDLGVADGDVLQVVVEKKVFARAQLMEMGYGCNLLTDKCFRRLCAEDRVDVLALFYDAGNMRMERLCFFPSADRSPHIYEYLMTFPGSAAYLGMVVGTVSTRSLTEKDPTLLRRLAEHGLLKGRKGLSICQVLSFLRNEPVLDDFAHLLATSETREPTSHKVLTILQHALRYPHLDPLVQRVIPHLPKLYTASYLAAVAAGRFDWADLMLENPNTASVQVDRFPTSMTEREAEYFLRLINRGQMTSTSATKYMRMLLQHPLDEVRMKVAVAVLPEVDQYRMSFITKQICSVENLRFLTKGGERWMADALHEAAKRFSKVGQIDELEKMKHEGMLEHLDASQVRSLVYQNARCGGTDLVHWFLPLCKAEELPSSDTEADPLHAAISNVRTECVRLLLEHTTQYKDHTYADGMTPLRVAEKNAKPNNDMSKILKVLQEASTAPEK